MSDSSASDKGGVINQSKAAFKAAMTTYGRILTLDFKGAKESMQEYASIKQAAREQMIDGAKVIHAAKRQTEADIKGGDFSTIGQNYAQAFQTCRQPFQQQDSTLEQAGQSSICPSIPQSPSSRYR